MGEANKVVSLLIGLFVVIVVFSVVAGRLGLSNRLQSLRGGNKEQITPTTTPIPTPSEKIIVEKQIPADTKNAETKPVIKKTMTDQSSQINTYAPIEKGGITESTTVAASKGEIIQIPAAGAPSFLIPFAVFSLLSGVYIRKKS